MTPSASLRDLQELQNPALAEDIRARYLAWLDTPAHQDQQCEAVLFGENDGRCCALGGLALVLRDAGFATVDPGNLRAAFVNRGQRLGGWPNSLPWQLGAALGWRLGWITVLNDDHGYTFTQIADELRRTAPSTDLTY